MRIIGGQQRGTHLVDIGKGDAAAHLRPTSDRVRENLFNIIMGGRYGNAVQDANVLDLFSGTGALGLEALSRGAASVTFVENGAVAERILKANIKKLGRGAETMHLKSDAQSLPAASKTHDLVFLDPPYGKAMGQIALQSALSNGWIARDALIIWEEETAQIAPRGFVLQDSRRYGETWITVLTVA